MPDIVFAPVPDAARWVAFSVLGVLAAATGLDLWLELKNFPALGTQIKEWAQRYPGFMAFLALLMGALVGHFFFSLNAGS